VLLRLAVPFHLTRTWPPSDGFCHWCKECADLLS
jgi:hypothetical protein